MNVLELAVESLKLKQPKAWGNGTDAATMKQA